MRADADAMRADDPPRKVARNRARPRRHAPCYVYLDLMADISPPVQPGDILDGKYEVERVLGHGGMGVVVAAHHLVLRERVALKFLLPSAAARPEVAARFQREAQAAARIRNEHVVRVSDVGRMPDGVPYMVMEYLEGRDFEQILQKEGVLDVGRAVDVVLQACIALAEAHRAGIVHRDLKPANLFLTRRADGEPCVKVLDFGISKVLDEGQEKLTNGHLGTPAYMPPEQLRAASQVDTRADVWSLGVILFELLAGRYAFAADSLAELFAAILSDPPVSLRSIRPDVPVEIEEAIGKCLQKDRDQRFGDVGALAAAIAPFGGEDAPAALQRIARTLGQRSQSEAWSTHASRAGGTTPRGSGATPPGSPTPQGLPTPASPQAIRGTAIGTSYTLPGSGAKRSLWIAMGAVVVGLVAVGAFVWRASHTPSAAASTVVSTARSAESPIIAASTAPETPSESAAPAPSTPAAPTASASPSPSARPSADRSTKPSQVRAGGQPPPSPKTVPPPLPDPPPTPTDAYGGRK